MMNSKSKELLSLLGFLYLQNGKAENAVVLLEGLQALGCERDQTSEALAFAYQMAGEHRSAIDQLHEVSSERRTAVSNLLVESRALWGLGRRKDSRDVVDQLLSQLSTLHDR